MNRQQAIDLGFKALPWFTVHNAHVYDIGRFRQLSFSDIGNCNEMLTIIQLDRKDDCVVLDSICLHNFDYDGYMTVDKLKVLIFTLCGVGA